MEPEIITSETTKTTATITLYRGTFYGVRVSANGASTKGDWVNSAPTIEQARTLAIRLIAEFDEFEDTTPQFVIIQSNADKTDKVWGLMSAKDFNGLLALPHEIISEYHKVPHFNWYAVADLKPLDGILWKSDIYNKQDVIYWANTFNKIELPRNEMRVFAVCFRIR